MNELTDRPKFCFLTNSGIIRVNSAEELVSHLKSPWYDHLTNEEYVKKSSGLLEVYIGRPVLCQDSEDYLKFLLEAKIIIALP
jgi:hypothetical protein